MIVKLQTPRRFVSSSWGHSQPASIMAFRVVRQRREARRQAKLDEIFLVSVISPLADVLYFVLHIAHCVLINFYKISNFTSGSVRNFLGFRRQPQSMERWEHGGK